MTQLDHPKVPEVFRLGGAAFLRLLGWRVEGDAPPPGRFVVIVAPHTSHWDAFIWMALLMSQRLPVHWLAKSSIFIGPWGWLLRKLGGIPIRRDGSDDTVAQAVAAFGAREQFMLALAPEGTRFHRTHWRSGFYEIAQQAGVPVVPVSTDFAAKRAQIGAPIFLSGDEDIDMAHLRDFYAGVRGKIPERQGEVRLRGE